MMKKLIFYDIVILKNFIQGKWYLMKYKPVPIGVDNFKKVITDGYYYVDKTLFIKDLLDLKGEVNLFTRPRRFGKSLNISMLQYFFENADDEKVNNENKKLFEGLKIKKESDEYTSHMCSYPVINISLKSAKKDNFKMAYEALKEVIIGEYTRHQFLLESYELNDRQKKIFKNICIDDTATDSEIYNSLKFLSECLYIHHKKNVIILIDEYDVPLENAYSKGFYDEMIGFIRSFFEGVLKTNKSLNFAVITGCLRISKESIFTGLNNLKIVSILSANYGEYFGFLPKEVKKMFEFYDLASNKQIVEEWYNGYVFGDKKVYNPWSIINYIDDRYYKRVEMYPKPYWSNTSSNNIVRKLIERNTADIKDSIEELINGRSMEIKIHEDITYGDIELSNENIWNFLFFTGYLKKVSERFQDVELFIKVKIPNKELEYIYKNKIINWFEQIIREKDLTPLYKALLEGNEDTISDIISDELMNMISYNDYKESFYHGFLTGILGKMENYSVVSNFESGLGRPDMLVKPRSVRKEAIIIEIKIVKNIDDMETACSEALKQIEDNKYEEGLKRDGFRKFIKYGVAFYKKECLVKKNKSLKLIT
ncbi:MAG: AAA family ATPase [Clostridiales bacterium]